MSSIVTNTDYLPAGLIMSASSRLIVIMECSGREFQQLGFLDLPSTDFLAQCALENHGMTQILFGCSILSSLIYEHFP
jgi:hypothetical protein